LRESALVDTLTVGGRLELRGSTGQRERDSLAESEFAQLKQADVYFDTRPNPDVRAFLRMRLSEETGDEVTTALDELWLKWDINDAWFFTAGKQHLKWGSGRFWNPTDFTARETRDPFALFDRRLGQTLIKLHYPVESLGFNYYAIAQLDDVQRNDDVGGALRGEFPFLGMGELALSFQTRRAKPLRFGADVSSALGPVDVRVETAVTKRNRQSFYRGDLDLAQRRLPTPYSAERRWFTQSVAGVEKTFNYGSEDNVSFGVEYFFNEMGYDDRELGLYALVQGQARPLYTGRHYGGAYVRLPSPGNWNDTSFFLNGLQNFSDRTNVTRLTATWSFFNELTLEAFGSRCFGDVGELCFRVPGEYVEAARAVPGLPEERRRVVEALPTRRTLVSLGAGLSMDF
jgi:hypothetical protein